MKMNVSKALGWAHLEDSVFEETPEAGDPASLRDLLQKAFAMATGKHLESTAADTVKNITCSQGT